MQMHDAPAQYDDIDGIIRPAQNPYLFGHKKIIAFLEKMRADNHLHHALLFEGIQGVGKATLAFHLAWLMLGEPHGEHFIPVIEDCASWRQIALGCHPGLLHISRPFDAKLGKFRSAITVDEIRKINQFLHQKQVDNGWRIVIIDPADDMNRNSANALLKILEEPPSKVLFILISHHHRRLLSTIRSRCQAVHFTALEPDVLNRVLETVGTSIGFGQDAQTDAQLLIKARGSVRQALLLLTYGGLEIAQALDDFLAAPKFNSGSANQLAMAISGRDSQVQFEHFINHLLQEIAIRARQYVDGGNLSVAAQLADLHANIRAEIAQATAYNLDKKHFVMVLLAKIHKQL